MRRRLLALSTILAGISSPAAAQTLTGAGATFPNPIYTKWFDAYSKKTGIQINYQSIGSGGGIRQYTEGTVGDTKLRFDGNLLVDVFMGRVTKWNDPKIAALNPGIQLPAIDLVVVHRSDGSGTTYVFTDYLNKFSPVGLGGKGNEGVRSRTPRGATLRLRSRRSLRRRPA